MNFFNFQQKDELLESLRQKDRYRILGLLGKGEVADIYSCFDTYLNRIVAMKQLRKECRDDEAKVKLFLNETKLITYLDHPGILALYDISVNDDGLPFYTMKLIKGNNLRWDLTSKTRAQLLEIFIKLCETLAYAHDKGVIHLDLNPENIMLGQYGEVIITDWGNAFLYDEKPYRDYLKLVRDAPLPPTGIKYNDIPDKPNYISPEQAGGGTDSLFPSSDIFSMGIILYEMMTGTQPFKGNTNEEVLHLIKNHIPPLIHEICPELPRMLSLICAKMLEKDPFLRYHGFHELLVDIDKFQNSGQAFSLRKFQAGEIIFREGELGNYAFTIINGSVEISKSVDGCKKIIAILGKNEIVGELAIFTNEPRTATVTSLYNNTVIRIMDRESVEQEIQKLSSWVQKMITGLSKRFIQLNELFYS